MNHIGTLSNYHSSIRVPISSIYLAYLEIILLNHLFLIILKIRNHLLFVINIINLLEVQYSISINWLLILILILRLQIHEIVKIQNSVMNQHAILLLGIIIIIIRKFENHFRFKNLFYYFKMSKI